MTNPLTNQACLVEEQVASPETVADHLLSSDLAEVFKHLRIQFWARSVLMTVVAAIGALFYALLTRSNGNETLRAASLASRRWSRLRRPLPSLDFIRFCTKASIIFLEQHRSSRTRISSCFPC
jgi:hypothetical protein